MATISAVDLFCGVGGLTHGLERAGIDVRLGVDIDAACELPFSKNNGAAFLRADITQVSNNDLKPELFFGDVSLLAGCAPCQPFSTYSRNTKQSTLNGAERTRQDDWRLVARFGEMVRELKPDLVTMENVPPLKDTGVFSELLDSLEGYEIDCKVVECDRIGLPQTRKRLVLVASCLGPSICIPEFDLPRTTVRQTIGSLPALLAGETNERDPMHRASKLAPRNLERIKASKPGGTWRDWPLKLRAECHKRGSGATYPSVYGRMEWDAPAPTITTQCFGYGNGRFGHPEQNRAISLREAAMLQGFPESYLFLPAGVEASFATLGRLIGNAVPVTLGEVIGDLLIEHVAEAA